MNQLTCGSLSAHADTAPMPRSAASPAPDVTSALALSSAAPPAPPAAPDACAAPQGSALRPAQAACPPPSPAVPAGAGPRAGKPEAQQWAALPRTPWCPVRPDSGSDPDPRRQSGPEMVHPQAAGNRTYGGGAVSSEPAKRAASASEYARAHGTSRSAAGARAATNTTCAKPRPSLDCAGVFHNQIHKSFGFDTPCIKGVSNKYSFECPLGILQSIPREYTVIL